MLPAWKCEGKSKIQLRHYMHIYTKNIPAKFHPNPIWNDRALGFLRGSRPNNKNNKMSSNHIRSVSDLKKVFRMKKITEAKGIGD